MPTLKLTMEDGEKIHQLKLHVLLLRENVGDEPMWVAQCIEYDICAQGRTLDGAQLSFMKLLVGNMILGLEKGIAPLSDFVPAPQMYWEALNSSKELTQSLPFAIPGDKLPRRDAPESLQPWMYPKGNLTFHVAN